MSEKTEEQLSVIRRTEMRDGQPVMVTPHSIKVESLLDDMLGAIKELDSRVSLLQTEVRMQRAQEKHGKK